MTLADLRVGRLAFGLFLVAVAMQPAMVGAFWGKTWDDSAITLAYAHTFALTGQIEVTPGSGVVEGYSTALWMFLLAGVARWVSAPATLLMVAKLISCGLGMLNVALVRRVVRGWGDSAIADWTAGVFGLLELTIYESVNAMESPLMLTLMLLAVLWLPRRGRGRPVAFMFCICLFLLARFEAVLLMVPLVLFVQPWRRRRLMGVAWFGTLWLAEFRRRQYFGDWLPNTISAKRHVPYSAATRALEVQRHLLPAVTLTRALAMVLIVLAVACVLEWRRVTAWVRGGWRRIAGWVSGDEGIRIVGALALGGLALDFAVGQNWGPPDRELFSTLPFLVYVAMRAIWGVARSERNRNIVAVVLVLLVGYRTVRTAQRLASPDAPLYMPLITVNNIAGLAPPVKRIREAAGLPEVTFATPDIGGVALFGDGLRILDLGLLCDRRLAHTGYDGAAKYILEDRRPELMEVHTFWTVLTGVDGPELYRQYVPVLVDRKRYFVRRDVFSRFAGRMTSRRFLESGHPQAEDDAALGYPDYSEADYKVNRTFGSYFAFRD